MKKRLIAAAIAETTVVKVALLRTESGLDEDQCRHRHRDEHGRE